MALHEAQPRIIQRDVDDSGLGRWTWMRIQGRQGHTTTVISAYRPNNSKTTPGTPYLRQQSHWVNKGRHGCPIKFFDEDLKKLIKARFKENDHVVLGIDANEDVRSGAVKRIMDSVGMRDGILDLHRGLNPPETCNKNQSRVPIDAIYVSPGIQLSAGGY